MFSARVATKPNVLTALPTLDIHKPRRQGERKDKHMQKKIRNTSIPEIDQAMCDAFGHGVCGQETSKTLNEGCFQEGWAEWVGWCKQNHHSVKLLLAICISIGFVVPPEKRIMRQAEFEAHWVLFLVQGFKLRACMLQHNTCCSTSPWQTIWHMWFTIDSIKNIQCPLQLCKLFILKIRGNNISGLRCYVFARLHGGRTHTKHRHGAHTDWWMLVSNFGYLGAHSLLNFLPRKWPRGILIKNRNCELNISKPKALRDIQSHMVNQIKNCQSTERWHVSNSQRNSSSLSLAHSMAACNQETLLVWLCNCFVVLLLDWFQKDCK